MLNYLKWLFRKKLVKVISGSTDWYDDFYTDHFLYTTHHTFYCYEGKLGKSWEYIGPPCLNKKRKGGFNQVKFWLET